MTDRRTPTGRLVACTNGVFAVIITIMVLDMRPPAQGRLSALLSLWPTALSYAVSYLFLAIIWINHHRLLLFAHAATAKLIWWNFAHLFMTSLIPFSTAWIANTRLAAGPVLAYAAVFAMVNIAFLGYQQEALSQASEFSIDTPAHDGSGINNTSDFSCSDLLSLLVSIVWLWIGLLRTAHLSATSSSRRGFGTAY